MYTPEIISLECEGYSLVAEFLYSPGRPGVHTLRNGDPGYPDDPPCWDITKVTLQAPNCPDVILDSYGAFLENCGLFGLIDDAISEWEPDPPEDYEPSYRRCEED